MCERAANYLDSKYPTAADGFSVGLEARLYGRQDACRYKGSARMRPLPRHLSFYKLAVTGKIMNILS
jgi:hypothetical protein